jgi:hypothetical protein
MTRDQVFAEIGAERERQAAKWGRQHDWGHGDCSSTGVDVTVKLIVLDEEKGEVSRAFLERDDAGLRTELVQVAAVACAILESLT